MNAIIVAVLSSLVSFSEPLNNWSIIAMNQAGMPLSNACARTIVLGVASGDVYKMAEYDGVIRIRDTAGSLGVLVCAGDLYKMVPKDELRPGVTNMVVLIPDSQAKTSSIAAPLHVAEGSPLYIRVETSDLREKPSFVANSIKRLHWTDEVMFLSETQQWLFVRYLNSSSNSFEGWIHASHVKSARVTSPQATNENRSSR